VQWFLVVVAADIYTACRHDHCLSWSLVLERRAEVAEATAAAFGNRTFIDVFDANRRHAVGDPEWWTVEPEVYYAGYARHGSAES